MNAHQLRPTVFVYSHVSSSVFSSTPNSQASPTVPFRIHTQHTQHSPNSVCVGLAVEQSWQFLGLPTRPELLFITQTHSKIALTTFYEHSLKLVSNEWIFSIEPAQCWFGALKREGENLREAHVSNGGGMATMAAPRRADAGGEGAAVVSRKRFRNRYFE